MLGATVNMEGKVWEVKKKRKVEWLFKLLLSHTARPFLNNLM
jgi:hypothetical protein